MSGEKGKSQSDKFIDAAKDLGADVNEETLRQKLGKLAKAKPVGDKSTEKKEV